MVPWNFNTIRSKAEATVLSTTVTWMSSTLAYGNKTHQLSRVSTALGVLYASV